MEKITYTKHDDYYIFSHKPQCRVYLGSHSPNDYAEDETNQLKRSNSSWYKEIHSGKEVKWDEIMNYEHDNSLPGNGMVWYGHPFHEADKREHYTWEGGYKLDFERKVKGLSEFGNWKEGRSTVYVPEFKTEAWAYVSNTTIERQKEIEAEIQARMDQFDKDHPYLINLHDRKGYVDDEGNPITIEEQQAMVKAKYGEDVFELAEAALKAKNPEAWEYGQKMAKEFEAQFNQLEKN